MTDASTNKPSIGSGSSYGSGTLLGSLFGNQGVGQETVTNTGTGPKAGRDGGVAAMDPVQAAMMQTKMMSDPAALAGGGHKVLSEETRGSAFGNTPVYQPLDVGVELRPGASWGTKFRTR